MPGPRCQTRHSRRSGALTVEVAMIAPLLFLFFFTSIEFGRINVIRHSVDNAAYEAARAGIVPGASAATAENEARRIMGFVVARGVEVDVTPDIINIDTPQISVEVSVDADENGWITPYFFANSRTVGTCTLRREEL